MIFMMMLLHMLAPVAQWIGHPPPKREIPGSSPGGSVLCARETKKHTLYFFPEQCSSFSLVVERWSYVPEVAGSTPARSNFECEASLA